MCGFAGYSNHQQENNSVTILDMLAVQRHRGPDDQGVVGINREQGSWEEVTTHRPVSFQSNPDLIFGFNRLSILDVSPAGHQPMVHADAGVVLMMNGEVYNAFDFKEELLAKGFSFKGHSDTEIVLYLYIEYGIEGLLERLNGMFALAIYDKRQQSLYLIRDRMGIKPLYVWQEADRFAFSSEMKSFKALPGFRFRLEEAGLSEFFLFRNGINNTLFRNIVNLTPGTYWQIDRDNNVSIQTYYDVRHEIPNEKAGKEELEATLRQSVARQMISDVKLGCQLSGGVDSSLVTAFAADYIRKGALETVSIVFGEAGFTEKQYIDQVAAQYGLTSHQFTLDTTAYLGMLEEAVWHFEQPINHPNTIGIKLLSREARKHVTVLLSGEGADESLAGYGRFLPGAQKAFNVTTLKKAFKNRSRILPFLRLMGNPDTRYLMQTAYGGLSTAASLYPGFSATVAVATRREVWNSVSDTQGRKRRKYELLTYLPDLLMRQDKMSMAHSIENRVPFLDNEMIDLALRVPDEQLVRQQKGAWEGKWLLKEICAEVFSPAFAYREKMGFGIPLKQYFATTLFREHWDARILPGIQQRGLFRPQPLQQWMQQPAAMTAEQVDAIWLMLGFEIWAQQYLD